MVVSEVKTVSSGKIKAKGNIVFPFQIQLVHSAKQTAPHTRDMKITGRWPWPSSLITSLVRAGDGARLSLLQPSNTHTTPLTSEVDGHHARGIRVPTRSTEDQDRHTQQPTSSLATPSTLGPTASDSCSKTCTQQLPSAAVEICHHNALPQMGSAPVLPVRHGACHHGNLWGGGDGQAVQSEC